MSGNYFLRNYSWKLLFGWKFLKIILILFVFNFLIQYKLTKNLTLSSSIINSIQTVISFLTSGVPYCQFIIFLCLTIWAGRVIYFYFLFKKSCIQGWYLSFIKFTFAKSNSNWCFTDTSFMYWVNFLIITYIHQGQLF